MLKGETAIVTGFSEGIGREVAFALAGNGADPVINGSNQEQLEHVETQIETLGSRRRVVRGDISDSNTATRFTITCMKVFGKIDILIDNTGIDSRISFLELTGEE